MSKKTLIACAVVSAMHTGYRRAGIALANGANDLEVNQEQIEQLNADKNLTVSVMSADAKTSGEQGGSALGLVDVPGLQSAKFPVDYEQLVAENNVLKTDLGTHVKSERILNENIETLKNKIRTLNNDADELRATCSSQQEKIKALETELAAVKENSSVVEGESLIDFSHAPEHLQHWLAVIHDMHCETPLTSKPKVDDLEIEVPGETEVDEPTKVKPSGADRDEAWQYYLDNVINHVPG